MSSEHSSGSLEVVAPDEPKGLILQPGGAASRKGILILERDPTTQHPKTAVSSEEESLKRIARQIEKEDKLVLSTQPATQAKTFFHCSPVILAEIELAALKCALLSFDHILASHGDRFTRSNSLDGVRQFLRKTVENREVDGVACNLYSLGLQYEKMPLYQSIRAQLDFPVSEFEHILLVASNAAGRCLDMVFIAFGFDPFGFRLSRAWSGENIAIGVVNGILRGQEVSGALPFRLVDELLCAPTFRRAFPDSVPEKATMDAAVSEVGKTRNDAFGRAILLVEKRADELLITNLTEDCLNNPTGDNSVFAAVEKRLARMFGRRSDEPGFCLEVAEVMKKHSTRLDQIVLQQRVASKDACNDVRWNDWLAVYRCCLDELVVNHGLPGDVFVQSAESGLEPPESRRLGELPGSAGINRC
jgi:hypothetical protein